jgi:pimeloyl-ACP methyl ester carboxylesterase
VPIAGDLWTPPWDARSLGLVVLLHGGGQTRHSWRATGSTVASHGWSVLALDARGHGDSGWAAEGEYSYDFLRGDLAAVLDQNNQGAVLVGASMGGTTALMEAGEHPGSCRALVLVDITPRPDLQAARRVLDFMSSAADGFATLEDASDAIGAYHTTRPRPDSLRGLRKNLRRRPNGRWYWHWDPAFLGQAEESMSEQHLLRMEAAARGVRVPTLLVRGRQSDIVTEDEVGGLTSLIPHARVVTADTGHMIVGDDNGVFAEHLVQFLETLDSRTSPLPPQESP